MACGDVCAAAVPAHRQEYSCAATAAFGESYTIRVLKNSDSVYTKSVTVDDFRGISISPAISIVFEHCILFGFKRNSSCSHAIYSMKRVVDYYVKFVSTVNLCALDISKAFDKMNRYGLFIKLMKKSVPINLLRVLEVWFAIGFNMYQTV